MTESKNAAFQLTTVSFRCYNVQADLIAAAAEQHGISVSDYGRDLLISDAARRLGRPIPMTPPIMRGRAGSLVAQAANKLGMSRGDFEAYAAQQAAADVLGMGIENPLRPASEPPPASRSHKASGAHPVVQTQPKLVRHG